MKPIGELTKDELLGLIFHHLPHTTRNHPCLCVMCSDKSSHDKIDVGTAERPYLVSPYLYMCEKCELELSLSKD